ncbi:MAG: helicase-related protein, partial [Culicoidibacterales bacterium]
MIDPITYLGYVRREDITIHIQKKAKDATIRTEYQVDKFAELEKKANQACLFNQKMVIYFPVVTLLNQFYYQCQNTPLKTQVTRYHGQLEATEKIANYELFRSGERKVMLATKAFGMGIDIDNVEIVAHFAPTGNICDYVQEIGRAARRSDLNGEAFFDYKPNDFKHINRLHGLSVIKEYQLTQVMGKIAELSKQKRSLGKNMTHKANGMLVDAENFEYIFASEYTKEEDLNAKVQTAMLLIEKDFKRKQGYSPFVMRPSSMFATGYFMFTKEQAKAMQASFGEVIHLEQAISGSTQVYSLDLSKIWEKVGKKSHSFPQFKYLVYTGYSEASQNELPEMLHNLQAAKVIEIQFKPKAAKQYQTTLAALQYVVKQAISTEKYVTAQQLADQLVPLLKVNRYVGLEMVQNLLAALEVYKSKHDTNMHGRIFETHFSQQKGMKTYKFGLKMRVFWQALEKQMDSLDFTSKTQKIAVSVGQAESLIQMLGLLEVWQVLSF